MIPLNAFLCVRVSFQYVIMFSWLCFVVLFEFGASTLKTETKINYRRTRNVKLLMIHTHFSSDDRHTVDCDDIFVEKCELENRMHKKKHRWNGKKQWIFFCLKKKNSSNWCIGCENQDLSNNTHVKMNGKTCNSHRRYFVREYLF